MNVSNQKKLSPLSSDTIVQQGISPTYQPNLYIHQEEQTKGNLATLYAS